MKKRLGVANYVLWMGCSFLGWSILTALTCDLLVGKRFINLQQLDMLISAWGVALGFVVFGVSARRLKDLNMPPWLVKLLAFPLFALMLMPYLVLVPGPQSDNQYGPAQPSSGLLKIAGAFLLLFVAFNVTFAVTYHYYETKHKLAMVEAPTP